MKIRCFVLCICVAVLCFSGCNINCESLEEREPIYHLNPDEVVEIEVFRNSVPADTIKKTVDKKEDIEYIVSVINDIYIKKEAKEKDMLVGGMGPIFLVKLADETSVTISTSGNLIYFKDVIYVMEETLDCDELWESLSYEEVSVGENGIPPFSKYIR